MCRHLAYLGPSASLRSVLIDPPHGLYRQAWAPRRQRYGTVNADGFGVGWYAPDDPDPARYRRAVPIWGDESFADVARVTSAGALLAAVRCATAGTDPGVAAVAPYASGRWLFSHNGALEGWPESAAGLAATLPAGSLLGLEARVDSTLLWALVRHRLELGLGAADALAGTVRALRAAGSTGRFNFLLTDGQVITATAAGDTLCYRVAGRAVVVASEPGDDEPGWTEVPDGSVVTATPQQVSVAELAAPSTHDAHHTEDRKDRDPMTSLDRRLPPGFLEEALRADARTGLDRGTEVAAAQVVLRRAGQRAVRQDHRTARVLSDPRRTGDPARERGRNRGADRSADPDRARLGVIGQDPAAARRAARCGHAALLRAGRRRASRPWPPRGRRCRRSIPGSTSAPWCPTSRSGSASRRRARGRRAPAPRLVAFLGSTIGNFEPAQRAAFLARVRDRMRPGDFFLLGTDLVKDPATLVAAYDDESGVTAEFNKNVLAVLNAELGADFDLDAFEHVAVWNADAEWIEMRLRSAMAQTVRLPGIGLTVEFADGEEMRTEVSAKFRREGVTAELAAAGFAMRSWWTDSADQFGLSLSVPALSVPD